MHAGRNSSRHSSGDNASGTTHRLGLRARNPEFRSIGYTWVNSDPSPVSRLADDMIPLYDDVPTRHVPFVTLTIIAL